MGCNEKTSNTCGKKSYDTCLFSDILVPVWSLYTGDNCLTQKEINEEVYSVLSDYKAGNDFSSLSSQCFTINTNAQNEVTPLTFAQTVIEKLEQILCPSEGEALNDLNISSWKLDFDCLVAACDVPITKLSQAFQLLITQSCALGNGSGDCCSLEGARLVGDTLTQDIYIHSLTVGLGKTSVVTNTAFGYRSLFSNTTGNKNTAIGYNTLLTNLTGRENTAIGAQALSTNTSGSFNVAIGYGALEVNNTGGGNTALGHTALNVNSTGSGNTAIGFGTLIVNTIGEKNVAVGAGALGLNLSANQNVAIGYETLSAISTGGNNSAVGYRTGINISSGTGNTILGANFSGTAGLTNNIVLAIGTGVVKAQYKGDALIPTWNLQDIPTYADNIAAVSAGLVVGDLYRTTLGVLMIRY